MRKFLFLLLVAGLFFGLLNQSSAEEIAKEPGGRKCDKKIQEEKQIIEKSDKGLLSEIIKKFSFHGNLVGYYQDASKATIEGTPLKNSDGVGYVGNLEIFFQPMHNGELYLRVHSGEGNGADRDMEQAGAFFADLNTLNDDNTGDGDFDLLELYYTHRLFNDRLTFTIGKTEPVAFIDDNKFANCELGQFVGKPFVNDPVLDSENEFGPLVALGFSFSDQFFLVALAQSSSRPLAESDKKKEVENDVFERPFFATQAVYSPVINGFEGNYRLYGWIQTYDHPELTGNKVDKGWGLGLSIDQKVHEKVNLFGRFGYHDDKVYEVPWSWSVGTNIVGIIPTRNEDEVGFGVAGLIPNNDLPTDDLEYHFEAYYKIVLNKYFALTVDLQSIANPLGNNRNDDVFAGMLKGVIFFKKKEKSCTYQTDI